MSIVKFLKEDQKARFLKKDLNLPDLWFLVHESVAREKVGHTIRDAINFQSRTLAGGCGSANGRGKRSSSSSGSPKTAAASLKDGVKLLQISSDSSKQKQTLELSSGNKRPSPRTIKRKSK